MNPCIGILAETKSVWERRVSLSPIDCKKLIEKGIKIIVQPSMTRCFIDSDYSDIGAEISNDLSQANIILGIQSPELSNLLENKTYLFFSHTQKGQNFNPSLLEKILEKKIRLIDYECIKTKENSLNYINYKRAVSFGKIAGIAGTVNILKGIGELLLSRNISTPFIFSKLAHMYSSVENAKENLITVGKLIQEQYLLESLCPFIVGIIGNGRVSSGVLEALECLPHIKITPKELLEGKFEKRRDLIYICIFKPEDIYSKIEEKNEKDNYLEYNNTKNEDFLNFDKKGLYKNPEKYVCNFTSKYLKYLTAIINCIYWEPAFPRVLSKNGLNDFVINNNLKLLGISDISCDLNGSIEILTEYTNFRKPFFIYEPVTKSIIFDIDQSTKEAIIYHAIPNLASSFPEDASEYFSNLLLPFMENLAFSEYPKNSNIDLSIKNDNQNNFINFDIPEELFRACITSNGTLTPRYRNIFRKMEEKTKLVTLQEKDDKPYFASIKATGHIFDSGFFHELVNIFPKYEVTHKVNYLRIGDDLDFMSVFYFDVFGYSKDRIKVFLDYINESKIKYKFESDLMKTNIY
jgi:alpha-aminoadipic semialdehyde synthase